jgi:hypothetical protein
VGRCSSTYRPVGITLWGGITFEVMRVYLEADPLLLSRNANHPASRSSSASTQILVTIKKRDSTPVVAAVGMVPAPVTVTMTVAAVAAGPHAAFWRGRLP